MSSQRDARSSAGASWRGFARGAAAGLVIAFAGCSKSPQTPTVDFNRDIRPILTKSCTACHGGVRKQGGISFVFRDEAMAEGASGRRAIVPGKPASVGTDRAPGIRRSRIPDAAPRAAALRRRRSSSSGPGSTRARTGRSTGRSSRQRRKRRPAVKLESWVRTPVDRFILARLESEGLTPAREADKAALLRRVSFDLTGLPPTPAELQILPRRRRARRLREAGRPAARLRRTSANAGRRCGWTSRATPTAAASRKTRTGRACGCIATGW